MRQLDNLFGPYIKKFKKKFNDTPTIDISFNNVGDGENGESLYRISISYLDNFVSDVMSSEDEWDIVSKMFNKLIEDTTTSLRRLSERQNRLRGMTIEMPSFSRSGHRVGYVDVRNFAPEMAGEPVEVRPRQEFATHWDGEIRDTGVTTQDTYVQFCDSLEEV